MFKIILLASVTVASIPSLAFAQEDKRFTIDIMGRGVDSCGSWTANRRDDTADSNEQWILGFLSGVAMEGNSKEINPLKGTDADGVWAWIDNYCKANPLKDLSDAGMAFFDAHPNDENVVPDSDEKSDDEK